MYTGTASRPIWWALVGVDGGVEVSPFGTLTNTMRVTDVDGIATALYEAPDTALDPDQYDRVKVWEDGIVAAAPVAEFILLSDWDWKYQGTVLDRTQARIWQIATGNPQWWKLSLDGTILLNTNGDSPLTGDWLTWYYDVAEANGDVYTNDDSGASGVVKRLSAAALTTVNSSNAFAGDEYNSGIWVTASGVYAQAIGSTKHFNKYALTLGAPTWSTAITDSMNDGVQDLIQDTSGNLWGFSKTTRKLHKFTSGGALTTYDLSGTLSSNGGSSSTRRIDGISYDGNDTLLLQVFVSTGSPSFTNVSYVVPWTMSTQTLGTMFTSPILDTGNGSTRRGTLNNVWFRKQSDNEFVEFEISSGTILRTLDFVNDWGFAGAELTAIQAAAECVHDAASDVLWVFGAYGSDYGLWRLPLP